MNMVLIKSNMLKEMEQQMQIMRKNLKVAQDRKKNYVDEHRVHKHFQVGEHVYFCIKTKKFSLNI